MSPLTRTFVVMLVVLSLLLTAATVVFVNQQANFQQTIETQKVLLTAANSERDRARVDAEAATAKASESVANAQKSLEDAKQTMNTILQQNIDKDRELGQLKSDKAIQAADLTRLAEALKASEDAKNNLQNQIAEMRKSTDTFAQQNAQLNQQVTDLTNKLEVTTRDYKFVSEQLAELKGQNEKQSRLLQDAGYTPQQLASSIQKGGSGAGAPPINGVIRAVRQIGGIPYATISVGSADSVARGMQFKVVTRDGGFLGILTVDTVELNESTGRLDGPKWKEIRPGAEVKTQL